MSDARPAPPVDAPRRRPLDAAALRAALVDAPGARYTRVDVVERTGSTNADLLARAADLPDRSVLLAEAQTAGRGRGGRAWEAPPRSQLALSVLLRPGPTPPALFGWLPLATGVALVRALAAAGLDPALKWPNDVLVGGRKIAGILVEATSVVGSGDFPVRLPALVVGLGLNVDLTAAELPVPHATSVALAGGRADRDALAASVLTALAEQHDRWRSALTGSGASVPAELLADYRAACSTLGAQVRVDLPGERVLLGRAVDVDTEGRLVVEPDGARGQRTAVAAGDVTHVRRADGGL